MPDLIAAAVALQEMHAILFGEAKANRWDKRDKQRNLKLAAEKKLHAAMLKFWRAQAERIIKASAQKVELTSDYLERYFEQYGAEETNALLEIVYPLILENALDAAKDQALQLGVDWTLTNEWATQWARDYAAQLVTGINETTRKTLAAAISDYIDTPSESLRDLRDVIATIMWENDARANAIAVTEVTRAYVEGNLAMWRESGVVAGEEWQTANDDLVCEICEPQDGEVAPLGESFGEAGRPPAHVNCILPGNEVVIPDLVAASQAFYDGGCVEITLANGRSLSVTKNHPILTRRGWVAAQFICKGDNVIIATNGQRIASSINPDYNYRPTAVEQVFGSFMESHDVFTRSMEVTAEDFHGDAGCFDGHVNIVSANSFLAGNYKPALSKSMSKVDFNYSGTKHREFVGHCARFFSGARIMLSASRNMCSLNLVSAYVGGHTRPFNSFGFGLGTGNNPSRKQSPSHGLATDASKARDFIFRFSRDIADDKVVKIRNFQYTGHVYDLQSKIYELYTCNSIVVKNCRCALLPVVMD